MAENMELFSLSMRCLYHDKTITGKTYDEKLFIELRDTTKKDALDYLRDTMPQIKQFITNMQRLFEYYENLEYDEWIEFSDDILEDLKTNQLGCKKLIDVHTQMCVNLENKGKAAQELCARFEELDDEFERAINKKKLVQYGAGMTAGVSTAAIAIVAAPAVGVAAPAVGVPIAAVLAIGTVVAIYNISDCKQSIRSAVDGWNEKKLRAKKENHLFYVSKTVTESLIPAIENFTAGLNAVSRYYMGLEEYLSKAGAGEKQVHFLRTKELAHKVIAGCQMFLQKLPATHSNLLSIEN